MAVRVATFNVENLFTRFLFAKGLPRRLVETGFTSEDLRFRLSDPESKKLTAEVLLGLGADVLALQEVEDLDTLKTFRDRFLGGREAWPHAMLIDGNDDRRIDVAVLSRFPIVHARSWQHLVDPTTGKPLFSRDCLEVDVEVPELGTLTLYVNHLKSMRGDGPGPGRAATEPLRRRQMNQIRDLVTGRFPDPATGTWIVLGDLNDYVEDDEQGRSSVRSLVEWDALENVVDRLPEAERWTHHFNGNPEWNLGPARRQLDYLLPSQRIAAANPGLPRIDRRGLPLRASDGHAGESWPRLPGVGYHRPKASDHCPIVFEIRAW